jgi:hypothetical protein
MKTLNIMMLAAMIAVPAAAVAHPGGLNSEGCHNDRKNGGYHCHRAGSGSRAATPDRPRQALPRSTDRAYANCAAARAAGAAPVRRGEPGYGQHLDRDNDGIGCE